MKDYLWVIVAGVFALVSFLLFIISIGQSSSLINRLKKSKTNILLNVTLIIIGFVNVGVGIYLLQSVREQIQQFSNI